MITDAGSGDYIVVRDPDNGCIVGELEATTPAALDAALQLGADAVRSVRLKAHERASILGNVASRVLAAAPELAALIATEGVKTLREARVEVARCVETLQLSAEEAKRVGGGVVPFDQSRFGGNRVGWWTLCPPGLVVAITPFNDPLNLVAHKLGPAFALGAPVILKPHPQTPFTALKLAAFFHEAGAPESMVQVVLGGGELGERMVTDPRPRVVSFTGGRASGDAIARAAGCKRLLMELGGVGTVAVAADADLERAVAAIHSGAFWAAGQNCVHAQRIIADGVILGELRDRLCAEAHRMRLGRKLDETTDMGPMVDANAARRVLTCIDQARAAGGRILSGGCLQGAHVAPTWIDGLPENHNLYAEEIFGPVSTIQAASGTQDLLARLSAAGDAIHAALFTTSMDIAMNAFDQINAGALIVNDSTDFRIDAMPFGGAGLAGIGREGVADSMTAIADKKMLIFNRAA